MPDSMETEHESVADVHGCPATDCVATFDQVGELCKHIHDAHQARVFTHLFE